MLLAIDIGNTNIKIALFSKKRLLRSFRLMTNKQLNVKKYQRLLKRLLYQHKIKAIDQILICSVVPELTGKIKQAFFYLYHKQPLILGKDIFAPVQNLYRKPEQVGQDRLANAAGAFSKYGGPAIIVDFGTALTFDLVAAKGAYLGGLIVPGIEVALQALTEQASLLPKVTLARPRVFLGRDTVSSINSGLVYGYSFLVEGTIRHLKQHSPGRPKVIATGGKADLICAYCTSISKIDKNLTLDGLRIAYEATKKDNNGLKLMKIA